MGETLTHPKHLHRATANFDLRLHDEISSVEWENGGTIATSGNRVFRKLSIIKL